MRLAQAFIGLLVVLAAWSSSQDTLAEPLRKARRSIPVHPARTAPDVTGAIAKAPVPAAPVTPSTEDDDRTPPPFELPAASRARVRACGETWRDMKLAGTTGDDDWREFALKCLVGKGSTALAD